jgi:hypothetical protein
MILAGLAVGTQRAYAVQWRLTVTNVEFGFCSELRCMRGVDDRLELAVGGPELPEKPRDALGDLANCFTPQQCANYFRHDGYFQSG